MLNHVGSGVINKRLSDLDLACRTNDLLADCGCLEFWVDTSKGPQGMAKQMLDNEALELTDRNDLI